MTERFANNPASTLNGAINGSVTSIVVTSATGFSTQGDFRILIDSEFMLVTGVAGTTFTVTRGIESSSAASHSNGATVTQLLTAGGLQQLMTDHTALANPHSGKYPLLSTVTTKGDLLVATGSAAVARLAVGANGTVPIADSTQTTGVRWGSPSSSGGEVTGTDFKPSGLTGATAASRYVGATASGAPASGTFVVGDFVIDQAGKVWVCTVSGTPGTWVDAGAFTFAAPSASAVGDAQASGSATSVPHSDHVHAREGFGTPGASAVGDSVAAGSALTVAHSDHVHSREAFGSPSTQAFGDAATTGSAATVPHSDHKHAMPAGVALQSAGSAVGTRPTINIVSGATVVDNPGSSRVDITISGSIGSGSITQLGSDTAIGSANTYTDTGLSITLGAGRWALFGSITVVDTIGLANITARITNSGASTNFASGQGEVVTGNDTADIGLVAYVDIGSSTTYKIQVASSTTTSTVKAAAPANAAGNTASTFLAIPTGASGGGGSATLAGLTDVSLASPADRDGLVYNGTAWVNEPLAGNELLLARSCV